MQSVGIDKGTIKEREEDFCSPICNMIGVGELVPLLVKQVAHIEVGFVKRGNRGWAGCWVVSANLSVVLERGANLGSGATFWRIYSMVWAFLAPLRNVQHLTNWDKLSNLQGAEIRRVSAGDCTREEEREGSSPEGAGSGGSPGER